MPVSVNSVTITGSSADFVVSASGSGFGIFSSYSTYASEALSFSSGSPTFTGTGSFSLSLDTSFGDLVFSGTDTIGASGSNYLIAGNESLAFVFGSDTLSFAVGGFTDGGSSLTGLQSDINNFYSSITTINSIVALSDTVSAAATSDVASDFAQILAAASPTVMGAAAVTTSDGTQFHFIKTT